MQFIGDYIDYPKYLGNHSQITVYRRKLILRYSIWANYSDLRRGHPQNPRQKCTQNSGEGIGSQFCPTIHVQSAQSNILFPGPKLTLSIGFLLRSLKHNSWKMKKKRHGSVKELAAAESYYEKLKPDCLDVPRLWTCWTKEVMPWWTTLMVM